MSIKICTFYYHLLRNGVKITHRLTSKLKILVRMFINYFKYCRSSGYDENILRFFNKMSLYIFLKYFSFYILLAKMPGFARVILF